jgi:hypothetical protein
MAASIHEPQTKSRDAIDQMPLNVF